MGDMYRMVRLSNLIYVIFGTFDGACIWGRSAVLFLCRRVTNQTLTYIAPRFVTRFLRERGAAENKPNANIIATRR